MSHFGRAGGPLRPGAARLIQINVGASRRRSAVTHNTCKGETAMPTIDIFILALVTGGAVVFMLEMMWFSRDSKKLPRK